MFAYLKKLDTNICIFNISLFLRALLLLSPITLFFYQYNNLTVQDLFFFQGIFYLVSILIEIPTGYISDFFSRRNVLIFSMFVFLCAMALWYFKNGFWIVLTGEILLALSKVIMDSSISGYLYDYLKKQNKEMGMVKYYGYTNGYLAAGTTLAAILGAYIYMHSNFKVVLGVEFLIVLTALILMFLLPSIKSSKRVYTKFSKIVIDFKNTVAKTYKNTSLRYYILYSGLLTSMSILFSLSFQPLMQRANFPVFMFGIITFINHFIRSIASILAGKKFRNFDLKKLTTPLYIIFLMAFGCIFIAVNSKNIILNTALLLIICFVIGLQLIFTILHISRLHKYIISSRRSSATSANYVISRIITAITLLSSKAFMNELGLKKFFVIYFILFTIWGFYLLFKAKRVRKN